MRCPRCKSTQVLKPVTYEEDRVRAEGHRCSRCDGHFFGRKDYSTITSVPTPDKVSLERIPDAHEQLYPLTCPGCHSEETMIKGQAKRKKNITVDMCLGCGGIWLDGGELEAIRGEAGSFFDAARQWFSSN